MCSLVIVIIAIFCAEPPSIVYAGKNLSQVVSLGETVVLQCQHSSEVTENMDFYWRTMAQGILSFPDASRSKSSSISLRIVEDFPSSLKIFCHIVSATDSSIITVKMIHLRIKGELESNAFHI